MSAEKLERARQHCFMAGVGDSAMKLCEANVPYGLAKIHWAQEEMGVPADATFVGSPDATITRNNNRWSQGFGYGGVYEWSGDFTVLDIKPNACGMLVGGLPGDALPDLNEIRARIRRLDDENAEPLTLDGVPLDNDLTESNHFIDVYTVAQEESTEEVPGGAKHVFIMHSSGHSHRGNNALGPGLYWDKSEELRALARRVETPWGSLHVLEGDAAASWYAFYEKVQDFNHRRRERIASYLFGDFDVVINATHQGLVRGYRRANIGCYTFDPPKAGEKAPLFPLTLAPDLPGFLVRGQPNVSEETIHAMGWRERIERHDLYERLSGTNLLPHGGGYRYPQFRGVARVIEDGPDARRFELVPAEPGQPAEVIATPRELPYRYRGMEVKEQMERLGLGTAVIKLDLAYVATA